MLEVVLPELQQSRTVSNPLSVLWPRLSFVGENFTVEVGEAGSKCAGDCKQYCKTDKIFNKL